MAESWNYLWYSGSSQISWKAKVYVKLILEMGMAFVKKRNILLKKEIFVSDENLSKQWKNKLDRLKQILRIINF